MVVQAVMADATAKGLVKMHGAAVGHADLYEGRSPASDVELRDGSLPVWATEHKCGNYPWDTGELPQTTGAQRPGLRRRELGPTSATRSQGRRHRVQRLEHGAGHGRQGERHGPAVGAERAAGREHSSKTLILTPAYYVFRHASQFVEPGAQVVRPRAATRSRSRTRTAAIVAVMYNSGGREDVRRPDQGPEVRLLDARHRLGDRRHSVTATCGARAARTDTKRTTCLDKIGDRSRQ